MEQDLENDELWTGLVQLCKGFNIKPTDENVVNMMEFILEKNKEMKNWNKAYQESDYEKIQELNDYYSGINKQKHKDVEEQLQSLLKKEESRKFFEPNLVERLRKIIDECDKNDHSCVITLEFRLNPSNSKSLDKIQGLIQINGNGKHDLLTKSSSSLEEIISDLELISSDFNQKDSKYIFKDGKRYKLVEDNEF